MVEKLDLRGLLCPQPVISTKKALDKADAEPVEALVDDDICVANLERLARSLKATCNVEKQDGFFAVTITKSGKQAESHSHAPAPQADKVKVDNTQIGTVVFIAKETFGEGDPDFSKTLANVFLQTMFEAGHRPRAILMANTGVKLMSANSPTKKVLDDFQKAGCEVLVCGLCVDYYGLKEDVPKEQITNMFAICEFLTAAEKVIQM